MASTPTTPRASAPALEPCDCPLCGGREVAAEIVAEDFHLGVAGEYRYKRCAGCATLFQSPRVRREDASLCYPAQYFTHTPKPLRAKSDPLRTRRALRALIDAARARRNASAAARALGRLGAAIRAAREHAYDSMLDELLPLSAAPGRLLEIGCGAGGMLASLARLGWEVDGVEIDPAAVENARRATGRPILQGDIHSASLPESTFDLVLLHHVFEHLLDPGAALEKIARILKPGGHLVLVYPNVASLGFRRFGRHWYALDAPRHVIFSTTAAIAKRAGAAGLALLSQRSRARGSSRILAASREYRRGSRGPGQRVRTRDRLAAAWESLLCALGADAGEETILVFRRG